MMLAFPAGGFTDYFLLSSQSSAKALRLDWCRCENGQSYQSHCWYDFTV